MKFRDLVLFFIIFFYSAFVYSIEVAITIDDIPANGELPDNITRSEVAQKFIDTFQKHQIRGVYAFLIGSYLGNPSEAGILFKEQWFWLYRKIFTHPRTNDPLFVTQQWLMAGHFIGNHTYNHLDLDQTSSDQYITDIAKEDILLQKIASGIDYKYFRYPYLSEGNTLEKRDAVRKFLFAKKYTIAQVTVDFLDYEWNNAYVRCYRDRNTELMQALKNSYIQEALTALSIAHIEAMALYHRDVKNILLIHFNLFSADMLDQLLTAYEQQNVKFISLTEALSDEIYLTNPNVAVPKTNTFLNQVRLSRGLKYPVTIQQMFHQLFDRRLPELRQMCR